MSSGTYFTTTISRLREIHLDERDIEILRGRLDLSSDTQPFPLSSVAELLGPMEGICALRAADAPMESVDRAARAISVDLARLVLPIWTEIHPSETAIAEAVSMASRPPEEITSLELTLGRNLCLVAMAGKGGLARAVAGVVLGACDLDAIAGAMTAVASAREVVFLTERMFRLGQDLRTQTKFALQDNMREFPTAKLSE